MYDDRQIPSTETAHTREHTWYARLVWLEIACDSLAVKSTVAFFGAYSYAPTLVGDKRVELPELHLGEQSFGRV